MSMAEEEHAPVGTGPVVLDIGEGIGAAVVTATASLEGREVEIRAVGDPWDGRHVAFHLRETTDGRVNAAVFPQLAEGDWEIRLRLTEGTPVVPLRIFGSRVTTVLWPVLLGSTSP